MRTTTDLAEFSARLTAAVRSGGGMVDIPVAGEGRVIVLVSPGVSVVLETHEVDPGMFLEQGTVVPWLGADDIEY
ncbi:hypothetical protein [Cryobacterium sp. AP23]